MDWDTITEKLMQPLHPAHVRKPSGSFGPKGDYIEAWHAIDEANKVFGFGSWSYAVKELEKVSLVEGKDSKGNPQWQAAYTCIIRVVVGETMREDVGFGSGFAKNIGDAVEGATKEAVTDALKRGLRTYGYRFGLALYDKEKAHVGVPEDHAGTRDRIIAAIQRSESLAGLDKVMTHAATKAAIATLPKDMIETVEKEEKAARHDLEDAAMARTG